MGNDYKKMLASFPSHPARKKEIANLNFQDVLAAEQNLESWFGFNLHHGRSAIDTAFLFLMFKRRHLIIHK